MIQIRRAHDRGHAQHGWLESYHTFSFADYHDPRYMGFRQLRVINEDRVQPGQGFGTHSHRDMEILSYVLSGALEHKDSMGTGSVIRPGEIQKMSAGSGVSHSEFNSSDQELVHFLQIWILPERNGLPPSYEQRAFSAAERQDQLRLVASRAGRDGSVHINQDVDVYSSLIGPGMAVQLPLRPGRHAWVQIARGELEIGGVTVAAGDGVAISGEDQVRMLARRDAEVLLFDLPG
ncbi:MAG TPA: pirin family protein [Terriglobales bacterium]|nr:pirin family protein [Terriglobales bacterium]